jgi:MoxR-like ATPase
LFRGGSKVNGELEILKALLVANVPVCLYSVPGQGKTAFLTNLIEESTGGYLHTMVAVTHDPTDFGGVPVPDKDNGHYVLLPGKWATDLAASVNTHPWSVLFLDEANTAPRSVLAALLKVVDERKVGNFQLPKQVRIVLAINQAEANGGTDFTPAMANRMAHLEFNVPMDQWVEGMRTGSWPSHEPLPRLSVEDEQAIAELQASWRNRIADFLIAHSQFLTAYPEDVAARSGPWPSRRTWYLASLALGATEWLRPNNNYLTEKAMASLVGASVAAKFMTWYDVTSAMDKPEVVLERDNWTKVNWPALLSNGTLSTVLEDIVAYVVKNPSQETVNVVAQILMHVARNLNSPGMAAMAAKEFAKFLKNNRHLANSTQVKELLMQFHNILTGSV